VANCDLATADDACELAGGPVSHLVLVRHGQAGFSPQGYGGLTPTGRAQAHALGRHLGQLGRRFDRVLTGPRARHRETCAEVAKGLREGAAGDGDLLPEAEVVDALDELPAERIVLLGAPILAERDPEMAAALEARGRGGDAAAFSFFPIFQRLVQTWCRGELGLPDTETWEDFRARVEGAVRGAAEAAGRGAHVALFTSGGPIACAVGLALGLGDAPTLELAWHHHNAATTELLASSPARLTLRCFNNAPHLGDPALLTLR
jgi:broad specificity phosphatase PhoE